MYPEILLGIDEREGWAPGAIITSGLRFKATEDAQGNLSEDRVVLDEVFWEGAPRSSRAVAGGSDPPAPGPVNDTQNGGAGADTLVYIGVNSIRLMCVGTETIDSTDVRFAA